MAKFELYFILFAASVLEHVVCNKEICDKCVPTEMCKMYKQMSKVDQDKWIENNPCRLPGEIDDEPPQGFAATAKGDLVCCPYSNIWGVENPSKSSQKEDNIDSRYGFDSKYDQKYNQDNEHRNHDNGDTLDVDYDDYDSDDNVDLDKHRNRWNNRRQPGRNYGGSDRQKGRNKPRNQGITQGGYNGMNPVQNQFNRPAYPSFNQNPPINSGGNFGNQNTQNQVNQKCSISSIPPNPQSGCCGLEAASERTFGAQNDYIARPRPSQSNLWNGQSRFPRRYSRDTGDSDSVGVSLDSRIAGGKETDLYQFPWTVLLKSTFDYGDRKGTFNCGGSLISSRYVLTAAHCLKEDNAVLNSVDVYLAEFDKRTFPRDCVNSPLGRQCVDNILTKAESVVVHPAYDDEKLANDIAVIRLRENVPYSDFTRPICLPPINIDNPEYSDLRLAVAGWGRNGSVPSEVKQSTVVNLVPQRDCLSSYPQLSEKHVCAAGKSGEDTCKGDSGGPLMMLYQGNYYVSGVVSGKRRDAPCGTAVPSLYTNVYQFVPWITQNLRN